jgi:DNA-binding GntR family transcriptional regulator
MPGTRETDMPTTSERAYHMLRDLILTGRYPSGSRLKEEAIARELSLSRSPVREALRRLEAAGLVELTPNSGARVWSWSEGELLEISQMRAMLEGYAAELAASKAGGEEMAELMRLADVMERAIADTDRPDLEALTGANLAFHRVIAGAAGNSRLAHMVESLHSVPLVIRKFALFDRERLARSAAHHREIIAALAARDAAWSGSIMRTHILAAKQFDFALGTPNA